MVEIWKQVKYRGKRFKYEVSHRGNVRNSKTGKVLKTSMRGMRKGTYPSIRMYLEGKRYAVDNHRLVAIHFVINPEKKPEVDHINGNHMDHCVWNTRFVTRRENELHKCRPSYNSALLCFLKDREEYVKELKKYGDTVPF